MNIDNFKKRILLYMIFSKIITFLYIFYRNINYGFGSIENVFATIAVLMPLFSVYLTVIIRDVVNQGFNINDKKE